MGYLRHIWLLLSTGVPDSVLCEVVHLSLVLHRLSQRGQHDLDMLLVNTRLALLAHELRLGPSEALLLLDCPDALLEVHAPKVASLLGRIQLQTTTLSILGGSLGTDQSFQLFWAAREAEVADPF